MTGRCHLCQQEHTIAFCAICGHWFCDLCRSKGLDRMKEAAKQWIFGRSAACCGPLADVSRFVGTVTS